MFESAAGNTAATGTIEKHGRRHWYFLAVARLRASRVPTRLNASISVGRKIESRVRKGEAINGNIFNRFFPAAAKDDQLVQARDNALYGLAAFAAPRKVKQLAVRFFEIP